MENTSIFQNLGCKRLEQLDGLRGICALAVLVRHLVYAAPWSTGNIKFYPSLFFMFIASFAHVAVLVFFVLSGFVIGYTTPQKFTWKEAKHYVIRRLIRLYPIYLFAIFLTFALAETPYTILDVVGHLFFMQGWLVPLIKNNMPLWSLHYEFIFYLMFIIIWRLNIAVSKALVFCILSGILSAFFKLHLLEIIGYFTIWLSGFWLAKKLVNSKLISKTFDLNCFWTPCILMAAFLSSNILTMAINKYGTSSPVLPDIILVALVTSVVAVLTVSIKIPGYKISFIIICLLIFISIAHSWQNHKFTSLEGKLLGYQLSALLLFTLPVTLFFKKVPIHWLKKFTGIGSISYALYVIHSPILTFVYRLVPFDSLLTTIYVWTANLAITVFSLSVAWVLECYLHVKIARKLKSLLKLS